jgi:chromate reductase, NAD(P)H dehydrogenase (quinone)
VLQTLQDGEDDMEGAHNVAVIVGSLRTQSINRKVANTLRELAPPALALEIVDIGQLPLYNQDEEANPPAPWVAFRERVSAADAVLFVTPEYNRSMPGVLKNAIDVGSRPYSKNAWDGKPGALISASPGAAGGTCGSQHLRQSMMAVNISTMPQPEVYLSRADKLFDEQGKLLDDSTRKFLTGFLAAFENWIERFVKKE